MLRQMQGKNMPRSSTAPSRLTRSTTAPVGEARMKRGVASMPLEATRELPENTVDGIKNKAPKHISQTDGGSQFPSVAMKRQEAVPQNDDVPCSERAVEKQREAAGPKDSPPALPVKKKRSRVLSVDTLPPSLSPTSRHALRTVQQQQQEQHRQNLTASPSMPIRRQHSLPTPLPSRGYPNSVVQQTEKITKRIQELLMAAQHGQQAR